MDSQTPSEPVIRSQMVIGQYYPVIGGTEKQAASLARALAARNVDVCITTLAVKGSPAREILDGVPVRRIGTLPAVRGGRLKLKLYLAQLESYLLKSGRSCDLMHAHQGKIVGAVAAAASKKLRKPVIIKIGSSGETFDFRNLEKSFSNGPEIVRNMIGRTDIFVATTKVAAGDLRDFGVDDDRIRIIPNGVSTGMKADGSDIRKALLGDSSGPARKKIIISVSRLRKNIVTLIEAAAILSAGRDDFILVILGEDNNRPALEKQIAESGLGKSCLLKGNVDNVPEWLDAADIFTLPSLVEGLPNALLEAMSAGLPCVVSDIPGNRSVVEEGKESLMFDPRDAGDIADKLGKVLNNPALGKKLGAAARKKAVEEYSIERVAEKYHSLYREVLG